MDFVFVFLFLFSFIFIAVAIWSSYKSGYYSAEIQRSKARLDTVSRMQYLLKTGACSPEWVKGAIWALKYSDSKNRKENDNVRD